MSQEDISTPQKCERIFTIVPIEGKEVIQKNFVEYGNDGDKAAADFIQAKKLTLARRFKLIERGYVLQLKEDNRKTMFQEVDVRISLGNNKKGAAEPKQ